MNERSEYRPPDPPETDMIKGVILELFGRHHNAIATYIAGLIAELNAKIDHNHRELVQMSATQSQTFDAAMADISSRLDKLATDLAADLAGLNSGPLNATQQAAVDSIKAKIDTMESTVLPAAPPAP
jgi:hypothetical protein